MGLKHPARLSLSPNYVSLMLKVFISSSQDKSKEPEQVNPDIMEAWLSILRLLEAKIKCRVDYQRWLTTNTKAQPESGEGPAFDMAYLKDGE